MDIFDEILSASPKEKFFQMLQHANAGSVELVIGKFIKEHIALREFVESKGLSEAEFEDFKGENSVLFEERLNDYFIGLTAEILGNEG